EGGDSVGPGGGAGAPDAVPAAGVSLRLAPGSVSGVDCDAGTTGAFSYVIGSPPVRVVASGYADVVAACTLRQDAGGALHIDGSVAGTDANSRLPISVTITSDVAADGSTVATLDFRSPDTGELSTLAQFPGCTLGYVERPASGAVVAYIDCPIIASPTDPTIGCNVHGSFAFVNCNTE
ncbi:MAG TPA: hypothetical protein VLJ38_09360, partial [Polyangiaceae bacterium]|nr:hypothetical protein [Polyangiaceae bacterium]